MAVSRFRVSERGRMALPAEATPMEPRGGGSVEVAVLGESVIIVPAGRGGLRGLLREAVDDAGGYASLAQRLSEQEPDLA